MVKIAAIAFGIAFIAAGLLGFVSAATPGGKLLGVFAVNTAHNLVHLVTGVVALWVGFASASASRLFFQIFGVVYGLVAALGFYYGDQPLLGVIAHNTADMWLHVAIAIVSLALGFGSKVEPVAPA